MSKIRKKKSSAFKFKVALAALKGNMSVTELSQKFCVTPKQIYRWKQQLEDNGPEIFADKRKAENKKNEIDKLYKVIGKITAERDFLSDALNQ